MTVASVCRATPALLLEEPSTFIIRKVNIESKFAPFCNICRPFGLAKTLWYGISSCLKSTRKRNTQSRHVSKIQDISGKFEVEIRIRNSNSKFERYLMVGAGSPVFAMCDVDGSFEKALSKKGLRNMCAWCCAEAEDS